MNLKLAPLVMAFFLSGPATPQSLSFAPLSAPPADMVAMPVGVVGRAAAANAGYGVDYSWPLSGAEAWFTGPEVVVRISDAPGRLNVTIDGKDIADLPHPGKASVTLRNLGDGPGPHHIEIVKYNESLGATGHILGIYAEAAAAPIPRPVRGQMEVIGDSWTAGYGNLAKTAWCSGRKLSDSTDARQTWGVFTAQALGMELRMTAYSGIGMVRNYDGRMPGNTMPVLYDRATFGDLRPVDAAGWQPSLIVISLGGNDFDRPLHYGERWEDEDALRHDFVETYADFVLKLRRLYPKAGIVLMNYGEGEVMSATRRILDRLHSEGETQVATYVASGPFERKGCAFHADVADYRKIAGGLTDWLRLHPELWQGG